MQVKRFRLWLSSAILAGLLIGFGVFLALHVKPQQAERIFELRATENEIAFRVATGGCTTRDDFKVNIERNSVEAHQTTVTLFRIRPDTCKGFNSDGTEIIFTRAELGLKSEDKVQVTDTISPKMGP